MGNWLAVAGALGGSLGLVIGLGFYYFLPQICEPQTYLGLNLGEYDCFGLGFLSRREWALGLGGAVAIAGAVVTYLRKPS